MICAGAGWQRLRADAEPIALEYVVRIDDPASQRLEVELTAIGADELEIGFSSNSVSQAGIHERFRLIEARDDAGRVRPIRRRNGSWRIDRGGKRLQLRYEADLTRRPGDGAFADEALSACDANGARLQGGDVFLFPLHHPVSSIRVRYELPEGWILVHPFQTAAFEAEFPRLRSLYHSVGAVGKLRTLRRQVDGCELVLAARGRFRFGDDDLMQTIARIARHQFRFFGGPLRDRYVFVMDEHAESHDRDRLHYFGLHFENSMSILLDPRTDRSRLQAEPAHIIAHEFFHNWNGELIGQRSYEMNWFVEGVSTYYAYQTTRAIQMLDNGNYARDLHQRYDAHYLNNAARSRYSLAEAGTVVLQDADVTRFLYAAGTLAALALDEELQRVSRQRVDLDDVMRELVLRARLSGESRWILDREQLEATLLELSGTDFRNWLDRYVYGREALPLPEYVLQPAR